MFSVAKISLFITDMDCMTEYVIDHQGQRVVMVLSGTVDDRDLAALLERLWADPGFNPSYSRLLDCTEVTEPTFTPEFWCGMGEEFRIRAHGRLAVVARSNVMRRMTFIYCHHFQPCQCGRFFDRSAADRWLAEPYVHSRGKWPSKATRR